MTQLATAQNRTVHVDLYARLAEASRVEPAPVPWLDALRRRAMTRFEQVGFPSSKDEEWRFTNVAPLFASNACWQLRSTSTPATTRNPSLTKPCVMPPTPQKRSTTAT